MLVGAFFGLKGYQKRRHRETGLSQECSVTKDTGTAMAQNIIREAHGREYTYEMDDDTVLEMDGKGVTAEIQGTERIMEME